MPVDPFSFDPPASPIGRAAAYVARPLLSRALGFDALRGAYAALPAGSDETFAERVLDALSIDVAAVASDLAHIPRQGPVIVAANHPRGALDGLVLAALLRRVRPDVRLLANYLLARIPELRSCCFFVNPFEGPAAEARSVAGLRAAHIWLRRGGALIMFPAGEVAGERDQRGIPVERVWSNSLGRLASGTRAAVVPALIDGANSNLFYAAGRLHPLLRTLLLPRELLRARGSHVRVRFGRPRSTPADEIARLTSDALLVRAGRFDVFCARATDIPVTLREIGRLRAVSYRAAGEGTAADIDLDDFDGHYLHLFAWDRDEQRVVGAYRIGRTDCIVKSRGVDGLYTRTLFHYGPGLIEAMSPALELGRSFVRPEYQRNYQALLLLWRGIGTFVVRHPQYRVLFGPVSISATYCDASHALLTAFLEQNHRDATLAHMVAPVHPRPANIVGSVPVVPSRIADVDRLVTSLESDGKGMPVLLRQYLKLNARALGFSVDPSFGDVLDALMAVDLMTVDSAILRRYFGEDGLAQYLAHHAVPHLAPAA